MKPKYRRIAKFLPAIISISMATSSSAALFLVDTAGNGQPAAVNNGTTTIIADGGSGPQDPTPTLTIDSTINMTGDVAEQAVIEVSGPNAYTINIASGALLAASGGPVDGIRVFDPPGATTVNNSGTVTGTDDGIDFDGDFGVVNNLSGGVITGGTTGIEADDNFTLTNNNSITGTTGDGINADNDAIINNNVGGTITGGDDGVDIDLRGTVTNFGSITGTDDGISIGSGDSDIIRSVVSNRTTFNLNFPFNPISGGLIEGGDNGIDGEDFLTVNNENLAIIRGLNGDGINADDDVVVTNFAGGTITGTEYGVYVDDDALIVNQAGGVITGTNESGVRVGGGSVVNNSGLITGDTGITAFELIGGTFELNNTGTVTGAGGTAISVTGLSIDSTINLNEGSLINGDINLLSLAGDDTITANFGSRIIGNVNMGLGNDILNFNGGLTEAGFLAFGDTPDGAYSNSIIGNVSGVQTINKTGTGVAFIGVPGNGGFSVGVDEINITEGGLYINGDVDTALGIGQTQINAGGAALGGTGTWDADIFVNEGGFSAGAIPINLDATPTNAVGTVTITGDVVHGPGTLSPTFIRFDVNPDAADVSLVDVLGSGVISDGFGGIEVSGGTTADLIVQTGGGNTYDLGVATNIRISSTDNNRVISDGVYTVLQSDEAILGSLGAVSIQYNSNVNGNDTGFQGSEIFNGSDVTTTVLTNFFTTAAINGNSVELTVQHDYANLPGFSDNQSSIGAALDASTNSDNVVIQDFIAALDNSSLAFVDGVLTDLTSLASFSTAAAITSSNHHLNRVVQNHLAMTRSQVGTVSRTYVGTYAEPAPAPAPATGNQFNAWGSFSYDWKDSSGFATDIDGEEASFLAGIDYRVAPSFLLGILLEGSTADYDFSGGGSDVDSFRAAIYGTYGEATGFYADFLVGYGDHDLDSDRTGFLGGVDTDTDAESLQAMLTVGYAMQSGCVKHGPFAGVEYSEVDVDGYTQGGFLPIAVDGYDVESTRLLIGYRLEAEAGRFTPYASIAYAHELDDDNHSTTGTLPGGATFGIDGGALDSAILISVGTGISLTESLGMNVGYNGEISTGDGIDSHGGTIGLNYAF
jgi:outer membrane autotransporter protein